MHIAPPIPIDPAAAHNLMRAPLPTADGGSFAFSLAGAAGVRGKAGDARGAAQDFVALTFVQPVLAMSRESNMAAPPFAPGDAERRFAPLLDAELARRIVQREGFGLVEAVQRQLEGVGRPPAARVHFTGPGSPVAGPHSEIDIHA